ncbi:MAG: hypothetical protein WC744_04320 [Patescibacteria group bacterium]|jgi:hypothetical protein
MTEVGNFTPESQVRQIVANMTNFTDLIDHMNCFRDSEDPTPKNDFTGVIRVGLQFSDPREENAIDGFALECGAKKQFSEWQRSNKRTLLVIRPMFEAIQTYIFR